MKRLPALLLAALLLPLPAFSQPAKPSPTASTPADANILDLKQVDTPPKATEQLTPIYPPALRFTGVEGEALLRLVVTTNGTTRDIEVLKTSHTDFATAATQSVKDWRYKPALKDKKPVNCRIELPISFTLKPASK